MKLYHEVAHIKDGNKITGYVIQKGSVEEPVNWGGCN